MDERQLNSELSAALGGTCHRLTEPRTVMKTRGTVVFTVSVPTISLNSGVEKEVL